ncbi:hypothetical protein [Mycobacterium sp. E3251]|uniref:hypothetical protein n=1 Tax=Mycobacterium sp. E3251 TaxID=1834144 RepID=UPI000B13D255
MERTLKALILGICLAAAAFGLVPVAHAEMRTGNYQLLITGRYDFHTWIWAISSCSGDCVSVSAIPQPVARAFEYNGSARFADGRYTLSVDVPDGLRCGDIYHGPVIPTHDVYAWDASALAGTLDSSFSSGCNGSPAGTYTYPFTLVRM